MKLKTKLYLLIIVAIPFRVTAQKPIWQLGIPDHSAAEFALAPSDYSRFLEKDFGWEDRFFAIGNSNEKKDLPYVLPGTTDYWGGTSGLAGIRPHELNILFSLDEIPSGGSLKLTIDILDCSPESPPLFKVTLNDSIWKFQLEAGRSENALKGDGNNFKEQVLEIPIDVRALKKGGNLLQFTTLQGSWMVFDHIKLEGPESLKLFKPSGLFIRNADMASYEISDSGKAYQPFLVDVQHLQGSPILEVHVDGQQIFRKIVEAGRHIFEVPVDVVEAAYMSNYQIFVDGKLVEEGEIKRTPEEQADLVDYVDTKIGTGHSRWMIAPGPWMPFSMVKISPDNQQQGWQAGYQPSLESVATFSHIHEWTMAGLGTFPTNGPLETKIGKQGYPDSGYRSRIDKRTEKTPLGYYSVVLQDYDIKTELTATTRCSFQRYTYPENSVDSRVLIDLQIPAEYGYNIEEAYFEKVGDYKLIGYSKQISPSVWGEGHYRKQFIEGGDEPKEWDDIKQEYTVHFAIEFDSPIESFGVWSDGKAAGNSEESLQENVVKVKLESPEDAVGIVTFDTSIERVVQMRTGISFVSMENAQLNLKEEITRPFDWDFDKVRANQEAKWEELLQRVKIKTDDKMEKARFYSNMYRALVSRNTFSDVDGRWRDAEESIQQFDHPERVALGCDAFWNTFWNLNQFWNLVTPEWSSKWVNSQLAMYDAHGWLAKGPAGMEYIPVMVAEHEIPLIVGAYQMGVGGFDVKKAFEAVYKMQTTLGQKVGNGYAGNRDLQPYLTYQYVPYNKGRFSNTLEYAFDDFSVSQLAKALGKDKAYEEFIERGYWWENAIDPEIGFARLRHSDGSWYPDFDPIKTAGNFQYVEGNAWQLSFFVPQDVPALAAIIGEEEMAKRLDDGFILSSQWRYNAPNELYWDFPVTQGNQQSMHFSFLFNWVKKPWLTQKWSRDIMDRYYGHGVSNAYLGDEDQGQMSAWFLMVSLGLFQTDGGVRVGPIYEIGSPVFEKVEIDLGNRYGRGKTFIIEAKNTSFSNKYVQSATLNGKPLHNFWFPAEELLKGGELILEMGLEPNKKWGVSKMPASPKP